MGYILLAVWAFCLSGCQGVYWFGDHSLALDQVDSLLAISRYEEARQVLDSLRDEISQKRKAVRMRYNLLCVKAGDRLNVRQRSDSLILSVVDYYEHSGARAYLQDAYYYAGNTYRNLNDANRALEYYQKALDALDGEQGDDVMLTKGKVYEQMGHLFYDQQLTEQAHESLKKARAIAKQLNDTIGMIRIYRDVGRIFMQKKNYIMAHHNLDVAMKLIQLAEKNGGLYRSVATQKAYLFFLEGEYESVNTYLNIFLSNPNKYDDREQLYLLAGDYYAHLEEYDKASHYYNLLLLMESIQMKRVASGRLLDVVARSGNSRLVVPYLLQYQQLTDSVLRITDTENIARINSLYNSRQLERQNEALHVQNQRYVFFAFIFGMVLLFVVVAVVVYYRFTLSERRQLKANNALLEQYLKQEQDRREDIIDDYSRRLTAQQAKLSQINQENEALRNDLEEKRLLLEDANRQEQLRIVQVDERQQAILGSDLFRKLHGSVMPAKDADWQAVSDLLNQVYPDFLQRLATLGILKEQELKVCMALKMGFKPAEVARLVAREKNTITNARARMYKKVTGKSGKAEDWDEIIMKL